MIFSIAVHVACLPLLTGHFDQEVAISMLREGQRSGPVLPPGRSRRSFPKEFKADAVAWVLDEGRTIASAAGALGVGVSSLGNWACGAHRPQRA
ncbi:transposase [Candidatus Poriferisodalis sp.]|uniref:transposase n=1 Tax=Candidatus Poriferisodalis sp. TaxID=3101277 RepID=UPI003B52A4B8